MNMKTILLVEDNPQDEMLTLRALRKAHVANRIDVARDGQQALDYLFRAGEFADRDGPDLPTVEADPILLGEVLGKLLDNAVKFTRRQTEPRIEVGAQTGANGHAIVYVRDNGVGFDLDRARNLYVMFQRQHHTMDFEGVGTGLAVVHRILERHGGRIWCETEPGQGCTFYLDLPAPERADFKPDIPL